MLDRLVQAVPGLTRLREVLLIKEEAHNALDWLLHMKEFSEPSSEQMVLMLRNGTNVEQILRRVERCKKRMTQLIADSS